MAQATVAPEIKFEVDLVILDPSGAPAGSSFRSGIPSSVTPTVDPAPFAPIGDPVAPGTVAQINGPVAPTTIAPIGDPVAPGTETTDALLTSVIVNCNKGKAKNIVATVLEFSLAVITILISEHNTNKCTDIPNIPFSKYTTTNASFWEQDDDS